MASVDIQDTPNPRAKRFVLDQAVQQDLVGRSFTPGDPVDDELIAALLAIPSVASVLTLPSSITINVADAGAWTAVQGPAVEAIQARYA